MVSLYSMSIKFMLLSLLIVLVAFYAAVIYAGTKYPVLSDFGKFYASAQFLVDGRDIYSPVPLDAFGQVPAGLRFSRPILHPNLNLPIVTAAFVPFTLFDYSFGFISWSLFSLLCGLAAIWLVATTLQVQLPRESRLLWLAVLLLCYYPTLATIRLGQVSLILFLLVAIGWAAAREGKDRLAGVAFGLAILLKVFVLILIPFFLAHRRWRLAAWGLVVFATGILVSLLWFGWDAHWTYLQTLAGITWYGSNWNASLLGFFSRILGGGENPPAIDAPWVGRLLAKGIALALFSALMWLTWRSREVVTPRQFDLGFSLSLVIMLLAAPLGWTYYFPVLMIAFMTCARLIDGTLRPGWKIATLTAFALGTMPIALTPSYEIDSAVAWLTWAAVPFYSLILLTVVLFSMMIRLRSAASEQVMLTPTSNTL